MENNNLTILGIDEIEGKTLQINSSSIELLSINQTNKTLSKKLKEIELFKELGIFPSDLSFNEQCVKSSFVDRHGNIHKNYSVGVHFPHNNYKYYINSTRKECGFPGYHTNGEKKGFDHIELITGVCLYGGAKFLLKTKKGKSISLTERDFQVNEPIHDISVDEGLSVYEIDAIIGLASFINMLSKWNKNIKTVHVEIPKEQYYLYLADAYEKGFLSPKLFQRCISAIDKRHDTIFQAYKKRLNIDINKVEALKLIKDYFLESLEKKEDIQIEKALQILSHNEIWRQSLSAQRPNTWKDLSYLSYIVVFLEVGKKEPNTWKDLSYLSHTIIFLEIGKKEPNKIVLQVDDPVERKILITTSKIIKKLGQKELYRIWAIYPLQKVFLNPAYYSNSDLYYCPNIELDNNMIKKVIAQYR